MNEKTELMNALADGNLPDEELAEAEALCKSDPAATAEFERAKMVRATLASKCVAEPDPEIWKSCVRRLDEIDRVSKTERFVTKYAWGLCGIFLFALLSAAGINRLNGAGTVPTSNIAGLYTGLTPMGTQAPSVAAENVRQAVGIAPNRIDELEARVIDLAVGIVGGRKAARLTMHDGEGQVVLFVVSGANEVEGVARSIGNGFREGSINGRPAISWQDSGYLLLVTADRTAEELVRVAKVLRADR
ncbi:MAG: hypothetical protein AB7F50_05435 [Fimbriimonadaceae bacterium]